MHRSRNLDLVELDPNVEGASRRRLREQKEARQQFEMAQQGGNVDINAQPEHI